MPLLALALALVASPQAEADITAAPFAIEVVDDRTGRGVPLIELRTVHDVRLVTDSQGLVAFHEPGLMHSRVFFHVSGHGYEYPKDGFGSRGKAFDVTPGGRGQVKVHRVNIAERLYRVTGAGVDRDSLLLGRPSPRRQPLLNAQVLGSDSVQTAIFGGKIRWFWGDTNRPSYPLGLFDTPTASSPLPGEGGLDPAVGVDLTYATAPDGFAAASAKMPGPGPTWIDGVTALADSDGREHLFAAYAKIRPPMDTYERGLLEFDPATERFASLGTIPLDTTIRPFGHPVRHTDPTTGTDYALFADPFPTVRVPATPAAWGDLGQYEAFTCLLPGSTAKAPRIDRDGDGHPRYAWRKGAPAPDGPEEAKLVRSGQIDPAWTLYPLRDADTGRAVVAHRGSVFPNPFRRRWVMIFTEVGGTSSNLGEVWFTEADTPLGPWAYARKVATHDRYSFYNPKQHPYFAQNDGRTILFEGTYTATFSGETHPTPRYDYNQIMYRLDLGDDRLALPVAIYQKPDGTLAPCTPGHPVAFFAREQPGDGLVPINLGATTVYGLPADAANPPPTTVPLYPTPDAPGRFRTEAGPGDAPPVARVWKAPSRVILPKS